VLAPLLVRLAERCLKLAVQKEQPAGYLQLLRGLFKFCYQVRAARRCTTPGGIPPLACAVAPRPSKAQGQK
jgi:hypothetical protein